LPPSDHFPAKASANRTVPPFESGFSDRERRGWFIHIIRSLHFLNYTSTPYSVRSTGLLYNRGTRLLRSCRCDQFCMIPHTTRHLLSPLPPLSIFTSSSLSPIRYIVHLICPAQNFHPLMTKGGCCHILRTSNHAKKYRAFSHQFPFSTISLALCCNLWLGC